LAPNRPKGSNLEDRDRLEVIAQEIFNLHFLFWALRHRNRSDDPYDLTEAEFVALNTLVEKGVCTVGELQQVLDVRPAQMSRIIRALENKADKPMISCAINPSDKRRVNVTITDTGQKAQQEYKRRRLTSNIDLLKGLSEGEQTEMMKLLNRFREIMSAQLSQA